MFCVLQLIVTMGVNYMRLGRTQTGMSSYQSPYISFHAFTWDRPKSEPRRPDIVSGQSYFRTGLRLYRSHVKRKRISERLHSRKRACFFVHNNNNNNNNNNNLIFILRKIHVNMIKCAHNMLNNRLKKVI